MITDGGEEITQNFASAKPSNLLTVVTYSNSYPKHRIMLLVWSGTQNNMKAVCNQSHSYGVLA